MKEGYFIYNASTILKGVIKEKVFRIEALSSNVGICGHIIGDQNFTASMYYRYYYIMSVTCKLSGTKGRYKGSDHTINICRAVEEVYDNPDDLMSKLSKKPDLKRIDEDWVKKVIKEADLKQDGFILNSNFDIIPVQLEMPIIRFEPVHVDLTTPKDVGKRVITVYRDNYKVEGLYSTDKREEYKKLAYRGQSVFSRFDWSIEQDKVFFTLQDAIEAKKKRFKITDTLEL